MGYACPVCAAPQADGIHLANHVAFTALLGRSDHADWLDDNAPDWREDGPETLAERITPHAEPLEFDDESESVEPEPPDAAQTGSVPEPPTGPAAPTEPDPGVGAVIERARELTERRHEDESE